MATIFYDHLIDWARLEQALDVLALDKEARLSYWEEIEHALHTEVLTIILEHLPEPKHEEFLERFHAAPHDGTHLHYLVVHAHPDIEVAITQRANQIITDVIIDLED